MKTAFLNRNLNEEIYMDQPMGFIEKGKEHIVCKLIRSTTKKKEILVTEIFDRNFRHKIVTYL